MSGESYIDMPARLVNDDGTAKNCRINITDKMSWNLKSGVSTNFTIDNPVTFENCNLENGSRQIHLASNGSYFDIGYTSAAPGVTTTGSSISIANESTKITNRTSSAELITDFLCGQNIVLGWAVLEIDSRLEDTKIYPQVSIKDKSSNIGEISLSSQGTPAQGVVTINWIMTEQGLAKKYMTIDYNRTPSKIQFYPGTGDKIKLYTGNLHRCIILILSIDEENT